MARARAMAGPQATLGLVAWKEQNLLQARGPVTEFGFLRPPAEQLADAIAWMQMSPGKRRLFVLGEAMGDCVLRERARLVGTANRRDWYLLGPDAVAPACGKAGAGMLAPR